MPSRGVPVQTGVEDAVAVVTGAGRGIGRAIALELAVKGARVVVAARSKAELDDVTREIVDAGGHAVAVTCDITNDDDVAALVRATSDAFGPATVLVNSAGAYRVGRFTEAPMSDFQLLIEVNYLGTVRVTQAFLTGMLKAEYGRVVNVASTAGKYGSMNQAMYNGSKHAVVGLTRSLGLELAKTGVRVNAVCPGYVDTPMLHDALPEFGRISDIPADHVLAGLLSRVPIGRLLQPEEISHLAVYLASAEADGIVGQAFTVAGGLILI